jgi:glycosyltransferase involved in cell wall biosynthesis
MRILVAPHDLGIGGSQINAIDLAAGVAEAGHDVVVYGVPGPLVDHVRARGLEFIAARPLRYRPAPSRVLQLAGLARERRLDLIHAYEWPPCLDAYYASHLLLGVPLVCTVLSMSVSPLVPSSVPLIMGTEALGDDARRMQAAPVWVLEPPIDVEGDHPAIDGTAFRRACGADDAAMLLVTVSRLAVDLKLDALVQAIDAVDHLAGRRPVQLAIVGSGPAEAALRERADAVNTRWGREVVRFTGAMADPRPAYAGADLVLGMGSSALRALAIGRPVVVQGEGGFSKVFEPATLPYFLRYGMWGRDEPDWTVSQLAGQIDDLLAAPARRAELAAFGRQTVANRFSLSRAVSRQLEIYAEVHQRGRRVSSTDAATAARRAVRLEFDNLDPRRKRARRAAEHALLTAAGQFGDQGAHA